MKALDRDMNIRVIGSRKKTWRRREPMPIPKERLAEIDAIPDATIDTSDIPEMDEEFFASAKLVLPPGTSREAVLRAYRVARQAE